MPELPEVQTVVNTLQPLVGRRLGTAQVLRSDIVHGEPVDTNVFARGRKVRSVTRLAKRIIADIGSDRQIMFHLGMTGELSLTQRHTPLRTHTHLRIRLVGGDDELRFRDVRRFGGLWLLTSTTPRKGRGLGQLGPDAMLASVAEFQTLLQRNRQIKALLLDQTAVAGLGNIYVDESLHKAAIHPLTLASTLTLPQTRRLRRCVRSTLRSAIRAGGSTLTEFRAANGEPGWFQVKHRVYGREGTPCPECRTTIQRLSIAGRSTFICPKCQKKSKSRACF